MPHFTLGMSQGAPMIDLVIMASAARMSALQTAKVAVPTPQQVRGLIDTGASHTCIDPAVFESLGLQPTGKGTMLTPTTGAEPHACDLFDVGIYIPNGLQNGLALPNMQVSASELQAAQGFQVLVGRDILGQCQLVYNGSTKMFTLAY